MSNATLGVAASDAGVASATLNASQQVGGSVGMHADAPYISPGAAGLDERQARRGADKPPRQDRDRRAGSDDDVGVGRGFATIG
jgi:hypothetical protein